MPRGSGWRALRDHLAMEAERQGIALDTYDPDFIIATIQEYLGRVDAALTVDGVRPFRRTSAVSAVERKGAASARKKGGRRV